MEKWTSQPTVDLTRSAKDRKMWKSVIANVCRKQDIDSRERIPISKARFPLP